MVLEPTVKVPLFTQSPQTPKVLVVLMVSVAPEFIVKLLQTAPDALMVGELVVPEGIIALIEHEGDEPHQLPAVVHTDDVFPFQ